MQVLNDAATLCNTMSKDGQREDTISLVNKLTIVSTSVRRLDVTHDGRNRGRWRLHAVACFMNFFSLCM